MLHTRKNLLKCNNVAYNVAYEKKFSIGENVHYAIYKNNKQSKQTDVYVKNLVAHDIRTSHTYLI